MKLLTKALGASWICTSLLVYLILRQEHPIPIPNNKTPVQTVWYHLNFNQNKISPAFQTSSFKEPSTENSWSNANVTSKEPPVIAVLVFVCNRPTVMRCLDRILQYRKSETQFPLIVSQDCGRHEKTTKVLSRYEDKFLHIYNPNTSYAGPSKYFDIARHYRFGLTYVFEKLHYSNVIILEDDLEVAPDFFEYFLGTLPLLKRDPTIWCISAWNDNGRKDRIDFNSPELLHRTDFFPGLGWLMTKEIWNEIGKRWPSSNWDDWMRSPKQRRGRACIRPEISRTRTFGKFGASGGMFFDTHLKFIHLNTQFVPFSTMDLSYLIKRNYDQEFIEQVASSKTVKSLTEISSSLLEITWTKRKYKIFYLNPYHFSELANDLRIMVDFWNGVPRTGYFGIVSVMYNASRLHLVGQKLKPFLNP